MIQLLTGVLDEIAVVGAHCDDIAIGMGGTLLTLATSNPGLRVRGLVLSGGGTEREAEEIEALAGFCPGADVNLTVLDVPDGRGPAHWERIKNHLRDFRVSCRPQVVFGPHRGDAHQDHRLLAKLLPTEFRDHLVLGYEILKWEADTPRPTLFHPLATAVAEEKARLLHKHYPSQISHDWFDEQAFLGLSRLRGVQCRSVHAEGFILEKATISFGRREKPVPQAVSPTKT
ncbi:PIG-L family deacetylase [Mycolicibacterium agri]|uniref:GlcNAc-PI de-N-acetylase n=1 Tax=Mycolicibacterium agri TaxID=36811 RepID=A0A2A7NHB0_MYCAG|nr:PIG-L family deacetylase [Mycolicibacterium agri]PEG43163.1 PIG-L family deacetylase [Mycolicibacterium agri]GFG54439.1 GlcNAc-PI de-N-acetylase [Mycolicibacterium agri]